MSTFIIYEMKAAVILSVFYLCYKLLLSKDTLHRLNRIILLGSAVLSFLLPICVLTFHRVIEVPSVMGATEIFEQTAINSDDVVYPMADGPHNLNWEMIFIIIYCIGAVFVLTKMGLGIIRVRRIIKKGTVRKIGEDEIVVTDGETAPFSWMHWIVMSKEDFESGNRHILEHEKAHIASAHSMDVITINLMAAFQWFNPVIWLMKADLCAIHEYEADDAVLRQGADIKEYQYSLIRKAVSASGYSITNSFNHSILKNRITMMCKTKSSLMCGLKALYIIPLVCCTLAANARTVTDYKFKENSGDFDKEENSVRIELKKDGNGDYRCYVLNGNIYFDDIIGAISGAGNNDGTINVEIAAPSELNCGPVEDIKDELRKLPGIKIKYSLTDGKEDGTETEKIPERPKYVKSPTGMDVYQIDDIKNLIIIKINPNDKVLFESGIIGLEEISAKVAEAKSRNHQAQINLQIDRGTSYGAYVLAQKSIYNAVSSVRDDYAMEHYGKHYIELDEMESLATRERIPLNVTESAPKNLKR